MDYNKLVLIIRDNISMWIGEDEDMAQFVAMALCILSLTIL
jgi:hypothetical protein